MFQRIMAAGWLLVFGLLGVTGYQFLHSQQTADRYRDQLDTMRDDYRSLHRQHEALTHRHNEAVKRTAVTELVVSGKELTVNIRTIEGVEKSIRTPFDPTREIYVDYVVLDGRLWIRRIFDSRTPPGDGLMIDPLLADVNWNDQRYAVGKAVYRSLDDGCWIVTVTGNGSLGLAKQMDNRRVPLSPPPHIKDAAPADSQVRVER